MDDDEAWKRALEAEAKRVKEARLTCDHSVYESFEKHGRCCPNCAIFMVDFGD